MGYTVNYTCANCNGIRPMHVAGSKALPKPAGDFICSTCANQTQLGFGIPRTGCRHSFWGFAADANGDVDMINCHLCGHLHWAQGQQGWVLAPAQQKITITGTLPTVPEPGGKLGSCTSCGRALCEALDADYNSPDPLTRCRPCRSR